MRPGPGLVVMALAFISGARRGSTSTSTSSKISATSYSTSSTATIATPIQTQQQSTLVAIVTPPTSSISTYLANLPVPHFVPTFPDQNLSKTDKRKQLSGEKHRQRHSDSDTNSNSKSNINSNSGNGGLGGGSGGGLSTIRNLRKRKKTYDFQQSDNFKLSLYELPTHFQRFYDQTQTSRDRRSISAFLKPDHTINLAASTQEDDIIVERTHKGTSYESSSSLSSSSSSLPASSTEELDTNNFEAGLTVQYAQPAAGPSNSFDEDDILGLVEGEEQSLISEESFDRLQKLTPSKISNANEEDYSEGSDSYSSTRSGSGSGSGSGGDSQSYSETTEEKVGNNYKTTSVGSFAIISDTQLLGEQKSKLKLKLKLKKESEQLPAHPEQELKNYYAANLVSDKPNHISSNRIATLSWSLVEENNVKRNTVNISDKRNLELPKKSIIESASPLTRLNPWISACDLAQPGTAPDLQGQCSASALPVAWVDEGPGPPICPESCAQRKRHKTKRSVNVINFNINKNYDNKFNENQLPYIKSNNYYNNNIDNDNDNDNDHVDHKNNNNYKNNNNKNKKSLGSNNNNKYDEKINNNKQNRQQITKHMSNKVRRNAAVKTEVSSANIAQIQRTTTTTRTRTATMEQNTGTTMSMSMTMTMTMTTPLSTTTTTTTKTSTTATSTETPITETQTEIETETEPEISTQETKNAKDSTESAKHRNRLIMANKWIGESQQPQQHVTNVTTILNNNNNDNGEDNDNDDDDDIVNKTNSNEEQQQYTQHSYDEELKYSYLLQPDEHNLDEYDSNKKEKLNGNDKFKLLHDEQVERQQQYQQEPEELNDDVKPEMEKEKQKEEQMDDLEMEKTQCLDYLGDSLETSPLHLCSLKSPGQLVSRLRTLRLRHCCERNVFSALHTIALNATLSGGVECVRILMDIIDLDALATRITCEYAEILFRFDCRQVYSLIHQCHDCKEAYRRWVCSTLVPYFAEPSDVITPIFNTTATTSNNHNNNNNNINNNSRNNKKLQSNIIYDHKGNMTSKRSKRNTNKNCLHQKRISVFENVLDYYTNNNNNKNTTNTKLMNHNSITQRANYSISTANNDPCSQTDSVISKVHRRTKRHIQFRRRKRIRPCLSVCQTVEQLCPYLLPADRAPAMPTQYAGEPTFLCLDLNIPEVTEQEESSINGRPDCCYTYCGKVESGICVQCDAFAWSVLHSIDALTGPNTTKPVQHNVTLTANAANALSARISIALRNDSDDTALSQRAMESLSYYAYYDGIYYYDDELQDMPYQAISGNCETVPSVTGRCTVPYYAVAAAPTVAGPNQRQSSMLWASLMAWCLYHVYVTTCHRLKYQRKYSNNNTELNSKSCQHWEIRSAEEATSRSSRCSSRSNSSSSSSSRRANTLHRFKKTPQNSKKLYRYSKGHIKNYYCREYILSLFRKETGIQSQITIKSFIQNNTLTYKSCKKINNNFLHISSRSKNNSKRNKYTFYKFQLFHYINFNINDWWRRWCEFTSTIFYL